jgi:hypothetical protein
MLQPEPQSDLKLKQQLDWIFQYSQESSPTPLIQNNGGWTNDQTIGFVTTALQDSALKWHDALSSRDLDKKNWEVVKTQFIKSYGTQINTTAACKGIS